MSQLDAINELFPPGKTICTSEFFGYITVKPGQAYPPDCINEFIIQILWWLIKDYTCRFIMHSYLHNDSLTLTLLNGMVIVNEHA